MAECFVDSLGALRFRFPPMVDTAICDEMVQDIIQKIQEHSGPIVFDLDGVKMVTSAFFRICIGSSQTVGKERLKITNLTPLVRKTFMIAQLNKILNLE